MKDLKDILLESIFDIDDKVDNFDKELDIEYVQRFLKKYKTCADTDAFKRDFKALIKKYKITKYKTYGWGRGCKVIGIMNNYNGFWVGDIASPRLTYEYSQGYCDWWQSNISDFAGTEPHQCKLYELKCENEFLYDIFVKYIEKESFI